MSVANAKIDTVLAGKDAPGRPMEVPTSATVGDKTADDYEHHLTMLVQYFEEAEEMTRDARDLSERDRDYYDNDQWTPEELAILKKRKQPALTINYIQRKVEFMRGFERRMRSDPKAFPRTQKEEQAAEAATDALRFVADQNDFDETRSSVYENMIVEGFGGADITIEETPDGDKKITIARVPWDRLVYDPHSRLPDFSDAKFKGIVIWEDAKDADKYGDYADAISDTMKSVGLNDTYGDRPGNAWCDSKRKRVRVVQMHYEEDGEWYVCTFTKGGFLVPPQVSPYVDKYGQSACSLVMRSAYIDRKNNRYGHVRYLISLQDEINKRRSKALHLLSVRQTYGNKQAVIDAQAARTEMARPDGHVELNGGAVYGQDFGVLPTSDMAQGQIALMQQAVAEMQASGPNAAMAGKDPRQQSGRALEAKMQGGSIEMEPVVDDLRQWTRDVYEAVWMRVRQFWTDERWVRVTDDERNIKFVGLNKQVTVADKLAQMPEPNRSMMMQQMQLQPGDPRLEQVVGVENDVTDLDVDIVIEEGPDLAVLQSEQFETLAKLAQSGIQIPPKAIIQASSLRNKDTILDEMEKGVQLPPELQQKMQEMQEQLQTLEQENQQLKGDRQIDLLKIAHDDKKLEYEQRAKAMDTQAQPAPEQPEQMTAKDMAEIEYKRAQAMKATADAQKTMAESLQIRAELEVGGITEEADPQTGERRVVRNDPMQKVLAGQQELMDAVNTLSAPKVIVRDPATGRPTGIQQGETFHPFVLDDAGRIAGLQ